MAAEIQRQFGAEPLRNENYGKIINAKHFARLVGLIDQKKVFCGGQYEEESLRIAPTILDNVTLDDAVMQEEIFGPVLPVLTFENIGEVIAMSTDMKSRWHCISFRRTGGPFARLPPAAATVADVSTTWSSIWRPAIWVSAASVRAVWAPITAKRVLPPFPITRASWTKKPLWICRCAISRIPLSTKN